MIDWKKKLTSRKFWAAVADFVGMLLIALHVADDTATQVTALIMAGAGVIAYILGEGLADAAAQSGDVYISEPEEMKPPETVETGGD
jgi:hypothetical protein